MAFKQKEVGKLLADCKRRCCICYRFCGVKIEIHHIEHKNEGGDDSIENAIPVCFECHAEIASYNNKHPRGRRFTSKELRLHRENWLKICKEKPEIFTHTPRETDVGPLQSLIDELDFNLRALRSSNIFRTPSCILMDEQFQRAIRLGTLSVIKDELKEVIQNAYINIRSINQCISGHNDPRNEIPKTEKSIKVAKERLIVFLSSENNI